MKNVLMTAALTAALGCSAALAQSATPQTTDPATPQPPATAPQAAPQSQQAPTANLPAGAPQTAAPASSQTPASAGAPKIAPGSVIPVQLTKTVDAKKAKTGDEVVAKVTMDMKNQGGEVLVPKDTKVIGHVTEAQPRSKDQKESQLAIAFDRAQMKNGGEMQMPMSIQAVIGQQNNQNPGGGEPAEPASSGGGSPSASGARGGTGGTSSTPQAPSASAGGSAAGEAQGGAPPRPPINAQTTGVIGISDLNLAAGPNATQGSVMSSEKNNVKLESGTMLLLKVSQ